MTEMSQMIAPQSEIADISHTPYLQIPDDDFAVSRGRGQVLSVVWKGNVPNFVRVPLQDLSCYCRNSSPTFDPHKN